MVRKFALSLAAALALSAAPALAQTAAAPAAPAPAAPAQAAPASADRYVGYYYPAPTTTETFESSMQNLPNIDKAQRIMFTTIVAQGTLQSAYRVPYAVFTKGGQSDHMIVVGLQAGEMSTIYRVRAVLANMTTMARLSSFFQEKTVAEEATFFDLLKMMGFRLLTVSDGDKITHQVTLK